jgi:hypothetical protein
MGIIIIDINWNMIGALGTVSATITTLFYTYFTFRLLQQTKLTVGINNKLVEFQIYSETAKLLNSKIVKEWVEKCSTNTLIINSSNESQICYDLLNPLEDLAKFEQDGLVSIDSIASGFGLMILHVGNNDEIEKLITKEQKSFSGLYNGIEYLYEKIYNMCSDEEKLKFKSKIK